jgi:hypothetical protein
MISNSSTKSARCIGQQLGQRGAAAPSSSARIISRTAMMRSASKNMCSVRQRPMPSAPNLRAVRGIERRFGIGADLHAADFVGPAHQRWRNRPTVRLDIGTFALHHLAGRAVDGDDIALLQGAPAPTCHALRRCARRPRPKRRACPCRAPPRPRGWSCRRAWSGCLRGMHAVNVFRARFDAHQDHLCGPSLPALGLVGGEHDLPGAAPGEAGRPVASTSRGFGIERRMQQLVERAGSMRSIASSRDQAFLAPCRPRS